MLQTRGVFAVHGSAIHVKRKSCRKAAIPWVTLTSLVSWPRAMAADPVVSIAAYLVYSTTCDFAKIGRLVIAHGKVLRNFQNQGNDS
ncbi:hypothetical protein BX600DRAFT_450599 [Xylariales sp. PMI_506]|nr:hypothetical protein BX600DRAFT_450599 [Xylariales sp. PMI_506]